jgi:hypothetical protein
VKAFFNIVEDDSFEAGSQALMQISGLGKLRPNMILMGYKGNWRTCDREELKQYFNVIQLVICFCTKKFTLTLSLLLKRNCNSLSIVHYSPNYLDMDIGAVFNFLTCKCVFYPQN